MLDYSAKSETELSSLAATRQFRTAPISSSSSDQSFLLPKVAMPGGYRRLTFQVSDQTAILSSLNLRSTAFIRVLRIWPSKPRILSMPIF